MNKKKEENEFMKKMTSAYANKLIKQLTEEKSYWASKEREGYVYKVATDEEPFVPDYDYEAVSAIMEEIDTKVRIIKHAINLNNIINQVQVGEELMTIDSILVKMSQLNNRKMMLDMMRKLPEKSRVNLSVFGKNMAQEYQYVNFDLEKVKADFEKISDEIMAMQIALDKYNQTFEFEVDID
jgi:hypothetical protein